MFFSDAQNKFIKYYCIAQQIENMYDKLYCSLRYRFQFFLSLFTYFLEIFRQILINYVFILNCTIIYFADCHVCSRGVENCCHILVYNFFQSEPRLRKIIANKFSKEYTVYIFSLCLTQRLVLKSGTYLSPNVCTFQLTYLKQQKIFSIHVYIVS